MNIITEIVNPSKRTGEGQYGKWNLAQVKLDDGKLVDVFGEPEVGQGVDNLEYDQKYDSWKGKLVKGSTAPQRDMSQPANVQENQVLEALRKVYQKLDDMDGKLDALMFEAPPTPPDVMDKMIDSTKVDDGQDKIPF